MLSSSSLFDIRIQPAAVDAEPLVGMAAHYLAQAVVQLLCHLFWRGMQDRIFNLDII